MPRSYGYATQNAGCTTGALSKRHAVVSEGANNYCYDANGNMLSGTGRTLQWTPDNLPSQVAAPGVTETYTYDADGERMAKT